MHRLFLGLPIPSDAGKALADWSAAELTGLRTVTAENLHVTLLFFGSVDNACCDELVELTRQVAWSPLWARTGELGLFGRSAVAVRLEVPPEPLDRLEDRLARASKITPPELSNERPAEEWNAWYERTWPKDDPLFRMALTIPEPENVKKRRRQRQRQPLDLHVTLARGKSTLSKDILPKRPPALDLTLDRLVLFESLQIPGGVRYERLAEGTRSV